MTEFVSEVESAVGIHHIDPIPVHIKGDDREKTNTTAARWFPRTVGLPVGVVIQLAASNPRRKKLIVSMDTGNTQPVMLSSSNNGAPAISVLPGATLPEMTHTDQVFASCVTAATVYVWEETYQ